MRNRINRRAFTLIEILIVVVILGILAAIVIPQFTEASDDAAISSTKSTLQTVRAQLELFKFKNGLYPLGNGTPAMPTALWDSAASDYDGTKYLQSAPIAASPYVFAYTASTGDFSVTGQTW